jgi:hypothetical protein
MKSNYSYFMKKRYLLLLLVLLVLFGCQTEMHAQEKEHYSPFANTDLTYEWDFNDSMEDSGGHTYNSTYFQLREYNRFQELFLLKIPYPMQYKHEEGHIYQHHLLNISDFDKFISYRCKVLNLTGCETTKRDSFRQYMISVSEGSADYYSINYFNNWLSARFLSYLESVKHNRGSAGSQHYNGHLFVNESIASGSYTDLKSLILDMGQVSQYKDFQKFLNK